MTAPQQTTPFLSVRALTKRFGAFTALLGPSGCGKTTLLNVVAGHLRPDGGRIEVGGRTVAGDGAWVAPQDRRVAMVFQDYALFPHLTVAENVAFALPRERRRDGAARARELLGLLDVADLAERRPTEISGGQQQRVALARALAQEPELVLLDEPFSSLDQGTRDEVRTEMIGRLRETGLACLVVTHDQEEALSISDLASSSRASRARCTACRGTASWPISSARPTSSRARSPPAAREPVPCEPRSAN